jgi:hypothetical protein
MKKHSSINSASVKGLVELWANRYMPHWPSFPVEKDFLSILELVEVALPTGRAATVAKVKRYLDFYRDSGIQTNNLFSYVPSVMDLSKAERLSQFVRQVYEKTLEIYQHTSLRAVAPAASPVLEMPAVEQLARELEPVLLTLREQHRLEDLHTFGFITTSFHFCTRFVLTQLTEPELVLLSPYFKFIEEQVCMPWQRVCQAAALHHPDSSTMTLVQQMLPLSQEIAEMVYHRAAELYPTHRSRQGELSDLGVMASTIRDLNMFQAYLWLCVLEESMMAVEQELVPLCVRVLPSIGVRWELVRQMLQLLVEELLTRVEPERMQLLVPYTRAMLQLFSSL